MRRGVCSKRMRKYAVSSKLQNCMQCTVQVKGVGVCAQKG